ncbi:MAG: riboflavin synthase [Planctomycetota bacterium]
MFTGLVAAKGRVVRQRRVGEGMDLVIALAAPPEDLAVGDSISLSGCCTTVTGIGDLETRGTNLEFHLTRETLARTWFAGVRAGRDLNLEFSLTPNSRMGGHFVQGHVDGLGKVVGVQRRRDGSDLEIELPDGLERYCVEKGSIAIDGVSLTIARIRSSRITIALIPHTMEVTTLGLTKTGDRVHVEADVLAKHVEKLLAAREI